MNNTEIIKLTSNIMKNLMQLFKNPKEYFKSQNNPNYKTPNSEEYLIYHLKQDIKQDKSL